MKLILLVKSQIWFTDLSQSRCNCVLDGIIVFGRLKNLFILYFFRSQDEKKAGASPLSKYVVVLRQRAQQRNDSLMESRFLIILCFRLLYTCLSCLGSGSNTHVNSSLLVGENSSIFRSKMTESNEEEDHTENEKGTAVFGSSWLPGSGSKYGY